MPLRVEGTMRTRHAAVLVGSLLLLSNPLPKLLTELNGSDQRRYGCLAEKYAAALSSDADDAVREYKASRHVGSTESAQTLLAALVDYALKPSDGKLETLQRAHKDAGATPEAAEDICRCIYYSERDDRAPHLAAIPPAAVGAFWAGRVLHERGRTAEALPYYRQSLAANSADPRTRLFEAIALEAEQRPTEALEILQAIPAGWAPRTVAYWRARALLDAGKPGEARALLAPLQGEWIAETTMPDASTDAAPAAPPVPATCLDMLALAALGDRVGARSIHGRTKECRAQFGLIELQDGQPFEALLDLESGRDTAASLRSLARLGACDWARGDLAWFVEECHGDYRPAECVEVDRVRKEVSEACPAVEASITSIDPALQARLEAPRLTAFEEKAVPQEWRWLGKRAGLDPSAVAPYPALADFDVVALSAEAARMFAVSVSQDVDPRGEVSRGGYWLHLSADHGRTWSGPFYLGFAEQFPYVVQGTSHVPAFRGDRLNLEVERREVDESTISFPPVGLRAKEIERDIYLSIDVSAVERDSDGDGLTDLLEEKLALDPLTADTDADGVPDGIDPVPLEPPASDQDDRAAILSELLPQLFGGPLPIQQSAAAPGECSQMTPQSWPFSSARTLFISGRLGLSHAEGIRVITLPAAAFELYVKKFGATYPLALPVIAFEPGRQRALVRYSLGWRGGSFLAERRDGRWVLSVRSGWIS